MLARVVLASTRSESSIAGFITVVSIDRHSNFKRETHALQNEETSEAKQVRVPSIVTNSITASEVRQQTTDYRRRRAERTFDPHHVQDKLKSNFVAKAIETDDGDGGFNFFSQPVGFK